jgi:hypothetical protein
MPPVTYDGLPLAQPHATADWGSGGAERVRCACWDRSGTMGSEEVAAATELIREEFMTYKVPTFLTTSELCVLACLESPVLWVA